MMPPPLAEPDDRLAPLAGAAAAPQAADEAASAAVALAPAAVAATPGGAAPSAGSEPREFVIQGLPVSPGVAIQNALVVHAESVEIAERFVKPDEVDDALLRYELALQVALGEVRELQVRYAEVLGSDTAQIFRAHELMLADKGLGEDIRRKIQANRFSPEYAVSRAFQSRIAQIRAVQNEFIRQREIDLHDVERRLLRALFGQRQEEAKSVAGEVCLVAHDLTPSQAATLDTTKIVGFALDLGGRTSHTAIVARALGIPAVVGLGRASSAISTNDPVIIDGTKGRLIVHPRPETLKAYQARRTQFIEFTRDLADLRGLPAETLDGYRVTIHANIEFPEEIKAALDGGAEGIGLYRTEFLYAQGVPDEARHFQAYRGAVELLDGRALVVRTLDLGADKFAEHLYPEPEPNPYLGCRSIRYCFQHPAAFRTQLRAILRASAYGPIKLMLPMITTRNEVRRAKRVIEEVKQELEYERIPFDDRIPVGIMVEVPSAALIADILATECAFLSIGTNDLVQYALAVDRMNERVADLYQPAHPAVLRLIRNVIEAGHKHGVEVSMCGEMSGEALYTIPLVGMGLRTFSISPGSVPEVKKVLRSVTFRECGEVVDKIFEFGDANDTDSYLRDKAAKIIPELF